MTDYTGPFVDKSASGRGTTNYDLEVPNPTLNGYDIFMVWAVWSTMDERGTPSRCLGYYDNRHDAAVMSQGQGWYGGEGKLVQTQVIKIRHTGEMFALNNPEPIRLGSAAAVLEKKRAAALAKLTAEERKLLGL